VCLPLTRCSALQYEVTPPTTDGEIRAEKLERAARNAWQRGGKHAAGGAANLFVNIVSGKEAQQEERRLIRVVLHSWRMVRLVRVAEESAVQAEAAEQARVTASAENDDHRAKVGETLYPQLQQKKAALRKRWAETRIAVDRCEEKTVLHFCLNHFSS
jgi:hypothetical protein